MGAVPQQGGGMASGSLGTVAQGMAFGTGSAIAHRAVGGIANSMSGGEEGGATQSEQYDSQGSYAVQESANACALNQKDLYQCLQENNGSAAACQYYFDALRQCQDGMSGSQPAQY